MMGIVVNTNDELGTLLRILHLENVDFEVEVNDVDPNGSIMDQHLSSLNPGSIEFTVYFDAGNRLAYIDNLIRTLTH